MDTNREELLYRFLDELKPDCQTIIDMQDSLDNAKEDKKRIDEENPKLAKDIENALTKQNELADYGKDMTSMGDKWLNLVHEFDLSFDFNIFATEAKAAFDSLEKKIENTKDKQKQNGIDLEAAEDIINFTPNKITAAIKHRENLKREI